MKIALLNDTHFGCRNDSPHFMEYQNRFYDELFFDYETGVDNKKLRKLGWKVNNSIEEGVSKTLDYFKNQKD